MIHTEQNTYYLHNDYFFLKKNENEVYRKTT